MGTPAARRRRKPPPFMMVTRCYELSWASIIGAYLALRGLKKSLTLEDYFAGIYLINRDALIEYWPRRGELDDFVRRTCRLAEPPWIYWIELHATHARFSEGLFIRQHPELTRVLNGAAVLALKSSAKPQRGKEPEMSVQHLIAALAGNRNLRFTRQMLASGFVPHKAQAQTPTERVRSVRHRPGATKARPGRRP